jgi:hypothetical protein
MFLHIIVSQNSKKSNVIKYIYIYDVMLKYISAKNIYVIMC